LYERLGGDRGLQGIARDFLPRALNDPRVDWSRRSQKPRGFFRRKAPPPWEPTEENVDALERHFVQFLALATGGPPLYEGRDLATVHADMRIANSEFDAALGDLKATLDKLRIPNREQKELLAILESTRPQVVTVR
jgi:hemoglobin